MSDLKLAGDTSRDIFFAKAGEVLFVEGEAVEFLYIVKKGKIRLLKEIAARQVTQLLKNEGEFLGEVALLSGENHQYTAVAETDASLVKVSASDIQSILKLCPEWIPNILLTLGERLAALRELMREHRISDPSVEEISELSADKDNELVEKIKARK